MKQRNGIFLSDNGKGYVITAQSAYKEIMWEIVKEVAMNSNLVESGLPAYSPLFEVACNQTMDRNMEVNSNGEEVEQTKFEFLYGGMAFEIYAADEEDIAVIKDLIEKAEPKQLDASQIGIIIAEEAEAFFQGQKRVDEVAGIIQNRVLLYMNE